MAVNHRKEPYPSSFDPQKCDGCKTAPARYWVCAERLSRSGNYRSYIVGTYCIGCADKLIGRMRKKQGVGGQ